MHTLSFTGERQVRFPAPDVARGFMLALIALANVPFWLRYFPDAPHAGEAALAAMNDADQWWYLVRFCSALVWRSWPRARSSASAASRWMRFSPS